MTPDHDSHSSPIKTPKQLIIVVVLAFAIPIAIIVALSQLVTSGGKGSRDARPDEARLLERIKPVGAVMMDTTAGQQLAGGSSIPAGSLDLAKSSPGAAPPQTREASSAAPGAPTPPVQAGTLPGATSPGSTMVAAAAPANSAAAAGPAPAANAAPGANPTAAAAATPATAVPAAGAKPDGKKVFEQTCSVCHGAGIAGAPKFGDKAAWAPRIAQGTSVLYQHALQGYQGKSGVMPPKGGNTALADADVRAAVDYMAGAAR